MILNHRSFFSFAKKDIVKEYKEKYFKNNKLKIGLSVSGNKNGDTTRDVPLDKLLPLAG